jgi:hypothetical protein
MQASEQYSPSTRFGVNFLPHCGHSRASQNYVSSPFVACGSALIGTAKAMLVHYSRDQQSESIFPLERSNFTQASNDSTLNKGSWWRANLSEAVYRRRGQIRLDKP